MRQGYMRCSILGINRRVLPDSGTWRRLQNLLLCERHEDRSSARGENIPKGIVNKRQRQTDIFGNSVQTTISLQHQTRIWERSEKLTSPQQPYRLDVFSLFLLLLWDQT